MPTPDTRGSPAAPATPASPDRRGAWLKIPLPGSSSLKMKCPSHRPYVLKERSIPSGLLLVTARRGESPRGFRSVGALPRVMRDPKLCTLPSLEQHRDLHRRLSAGSLESRDLTRTQTVSSSRPQNVTGGGAAPLTPLNCEVLARSLALFHAEGLLLLCKMLMVRPRLLAPSCAQVTLRSSLAPAA